MTATVQTLPSTLFVAVLLLFVFAGPFVAVWASNKTERKDGQS